MAFIYSQAKWGWVLNQKEQWIHEQRRINMTRNWEGNEKENNSNVGRSLVTSCKWLTVFINASINRCHLPIRWFRFSLDSVAPHLDLPSLGCRKLLVGKSVEELNEVACTLIISQFTGVLKILSVSVARHLQESNLSESGATKVYLIVQDCLLYNYRSFVFFIKQFLGVEKSMQFILHFRTHF